MKKTYQLHAEGKNSDRLLESTKNDIRKYLKRERKKDVPADADYITFVCKLGLDEDNAQPLHAGEIIKSVDAIAKTDANSFFVEITSTYVSRSLYEDNEN